MSEEQKWEELRMEMRGFFDEFDYAKTGKLGVDEVTAILKSIGLRCSPSDVREMMSEVIGPNSTEVTYEELMEILKRHSQTEDEEELMRQAFTVIAGSPDGLITAEKLQCFMQSLGEDFTLEHAKRMLRAAGQWNLAEGEEPKPINFDQYKSVQQNKWARQ